MLEVEPRRLLVMRSEWKSSAPACWCRKPSLFGVLSTALVVLAAAGYFTALNTFQRAGKFASIDQILPFWALVIGPAWLILASIYLWLFGKRGLWILVGLPFALTPTGLCLLLIAACLPGRPCPWGFKVAHDDRSHFGAIGSKIAVGS